MPDETVQSPIAASRLSRHILVRTYALTVLSVALTTLLRVSLNPLLGRKAAFIVYFPALVFSAWLGGWGSGLVALVLSTLVAVYLFITPAHSLTITNRDDQITLAVFFLVGLSVSALSASQRNAHRQAEDARQMAQQAAEAAKHNAEDAKRSAEDAEQRGRALAVSEERYRLLVESTGDGIYGIDLEGRFTFVNRAAEQMLGFTKNELLGCGGHTLIHHTRPDGTPYPEDECPIYYALRSGETVAVEDDVFWRSDGTAFSVAYRAAPIVEHDAVRGAVVTFSDISERKALEAERAALAQREHRIAEQLQAALQPPMPTAVPGLLLADYYRPAWEDQGVGGDFVDIFSDDKGMTFLVVGDLSGKGLAAASQVATVRNMLRFSLYNGRSVAGPVTALNRTLADHHLLTGFTTLFVGRYDAAARLLTYVNCGQDAGLVLRSASGNVERLSPTGPVLGALSGAVYAEETSILEAGDVLALFTDGLTEAGPSRTALLTGDGVAALLAQLTGIASPQVIAERLIAGVDTFAGAGVRDDQCLLVGVVA